MKHCWQTLPLGDRIGHCYFKLTFSIFFQNFCLYRHLLLALQNIATGENMTIEQNTGKRMQKWPTAQSRAAGISVYCSRNSRCASFPRPAACPLCTRFLTVCPQQYFPRKTVFPAVGALLSLTNKPLSKIVLNRNFIKAANPPYRHWSRAVVSPKPVECVFW